MHYDGPVSLPYGGDAGSFTFGGIIMNYSELKQIFRELKATSPRDDLTAHIIFTEDMEIVVSDWEPTANYLMCQSRNTVGGDADGKGT